MNFWKLTISLLCTLAYSQHIEIVQSANNPVAVQLINHGQSTVVPFGFHYQAGSQVAWYYPADELDSNSFNGTEVYTVSISDPSYPDLLAASDTLSREAQWNQNQTLSNFQVLTKHGSCSQPLTDIPSTQHQVSEINAILSQVNYYNASHKYLDTLGSQGGDFSGRWRDSFGDETQIQWAIGGTASPSSWAGHLSDTNQSSDPMYWMALAAGQELLNFDAQYLMAVGIKETGIGSSYNDNRMTNQDGAYGAFESESWTGISRAGMYPELFAGFSECEAELRSGNINGFEACMGKGSQDLMGEIFGVDSSRNTGPELVNSVFFSGFTIHAYYDLLLTATDFCGKSAMSNSADPYLGICAMAGHYNLGINGGVPSALKNASLISAADACDSVPVGNSNYVPAIRSIVEAISTDQNRWVQNEAGVYLIDKEITLNHIQRFLFGDSADYNTESKNGLLWHFALDSTQRLTLWNEVEATFNLQKAHWGKESISFRYDWVTMLRLIKSHLDFMIQLNTSHDDANRYINQHSSGSICEVNTVIDTTWPYIFYDTTISNNDGLTVNAGVYDDNEVIQLQYQYDGSSIWYDAELNLDSNGYYVGQFALDANQGDFAWVRTSDQCHNITSFQIPIPSEAIVPLFNHTSAPIEQSQIGTLFSIQGSKIGEIKMIQGIWNFPSETPHGHYVVKPVNSGGFIVFHSQ